MKASLPWIAESYTKRGGSIALWWDHAGDTGSPGGLPFFLQWDDGDHETYTLYCQVPDGGRYSAPMAAGLAADRFEFDLVAVAE